MARDHSSTARPGPTSRPHAARDRGWIRSAAQVRALVSPARQEIVDALDAAGPCSVSALAALVGRAPDGLYFHLRRLEACGLIMECGRTQQGRHAWAMYDVKERPVRLDYNALPADSVASVISAAMRLGMRDFKRAVRKGGVVVRGSNRDLWGARIKGWITPHNIRRINEVLNELRELMHNRGPARGTKAMSISFILAPADIPDRVASTVNGAATRPAAPPRSRRPSTK